jgi:hypothetical protein
MPMADQTDLDFEREKWKADLELRKRELTLKERESARARWSNPLALGIFAAALAAIGNAGVSWVNGQEQRTLETIRSTQSLALEEKKAEATRILEVIKTGDPDKAAENLQFLTNTGLIAEPTRLSALKYYLDTRIPGEGPKLGTDACKLYPNLC